VDNCKVFFDGAELHFANGDYAEARKLYERVLLMSCPRSTEASVRLVDIQKIEYDRTKRIQVIAYEFGVGTAPVNKINTPIGITAGAYKEKKFSGYFSLSLSTSLFAALQKDYDKSEKSEFNVSAGWTTMRLQAPVWGFFGIGYTGVSKWDWDDLSDSGKPTLYMRNAVSPELGLLGKIGPLALRYTFQYRFALNKEEQDEIGKMRHVFGIGICF
jgi:hypothetical protein